MLKEANLISIIWSINNNHITYSDETSNAIVCEEIVKILQRFCNFYFPKRKNLSIPSPSHPPKVGLYFAWKILLSLKILLHVLNTVDRTQRETEQNLGVQSLRVLLPERRRISLDPPLSSNMYSPQPLWGPGSHIFPFCWWNLVTFSFFRSPVVLQDTLVLGLLHSEAGQSLLNILGTGVDTVDKLVSLGRYYMYMYFVLGRDM